VRLRALPLLLVLTAGDYALWDWSIASGHDVVSLVAGLALLPLAAATLAMASLGVARLLGVALEASSARRRSAAGKPHRRARARARVDPAAATPTPAEEAERERSSRRLAA
jgi:hypothetical protein